METGGKRIQGSTPVVLLLQGASESPGSDCKSIDSGPSPEGSDSAGCGWAHGQRISKEFPGAGELWSGSNLGSHCSLQDLDAGG